MTACNDKVLRVFEVSGSTGTDAQTLQGHQTSIKCAVWSKEPSVVVSCGEDPQLRSYFGSSILSTFFSSLPPWLWYHGCLMLWENIEAVTGKFGKIGSTIPPALLKASSSFLLLSPPSLPSPFLSYFSLPYFLPSSFSSNTECGIYEVAQW